MRIRRNAQCVLGVSSAIAQEMTSSCWCQSRTVTLELRRPLPPTLRCHAVRNQPLARACELRIPRKDERGASLSHPIAAIARQIAAPGPGWRRGGPLRPPALGVPSPSSARAPYAEEASTHLKSQNSARQRVFRPPEVSKRSPSPPSAMLERSTAVVAPGETSQSQKRW